MSYVAVIPAAGSGSRMGAAIPKVLLEISGESGCGETVLTRTVGVFARDPLCRAVVVCAPHAWRRSFEESLAIWSTVQIVDGGATRQESVRIGVEHVSRTMNCPLDMPVLVHDAARCCLTLDLVRRILEGVREHRAVTAAVRVIDSLCREQDGSIERHVEREKVWAIQTPQGFVLGDLLDAHRHALSTGATALDDAALVARTRAIHLIQGDRFNIKITEPDDLESVRAILHARQSRTTE